MTTCSATCETKGGFKHIKRSWIGYETFHTQCVSTTAFSQHCPITIAVSGLFDTNDASYELKMPVWFYSLGVTISQKHAQQQGFFFFLHHLSDCTVNQTRTF